MCADREGAFVAGVPRLATRERSKGSVLSAFTVRSISWIMCREEDPPLFLNTNELIEGRTIRFQK